MGFGIFNIRDMRRAFYQRSLGELRSVLPDPTAHRPSPHDDGRRLWHNLPMRLKVTTLNVNGLRSAERRGFRRWLTRAKPDVLCLQEIRCDEECVPRTMWRPRGWKVAWHPAAKKGYAGTAVWARATEARFSVGSGHMRGDEEGRAVCVHLPELDIWSLYMPSGSSGPERQAWKFEFMEHAWEFLERLRTSGRPTILCGDLNIAHRPIDLKNWRSNQKNSGFLPEERAYLDRVFAAGWRDLFRERHPDKVAYSWWSNRGRAREKDVGWRLDYILATPGISIVDCAIEREAGLSDHAPVSAWIEVPLVRRGTVLTAPEATAEN